MYLCYVNDGSENISRMKSFSLKVPSTKSTADFFSRNVELKISHVVQKYFDICSMIILKIRCEKII